MAQFSMEIMRLTGSVLGGNQQFLSRRAVLFVLFVCEEDCSCGLCLSLCLALCRPGSDLLSRVLRRSTIGAGEFHGRVRDGIGCISPRHDHQAGEGQELGSPCWRAER